MRTSRLAPGLAASLGLSALIIAPTAAPAYAVDCVDPVPLRILSFTDFHGRIAASNPDTAVFFAALEANRDADTVVVSNGDNIGATLFPSMIANDEPTIDILNALEIDASSVGNHELDKGYQDFTGRVMTNSEFPYVSANLIDVVDGESVADAPFTVVTTASGVDVAIVGAITEELPSLINPGFFDFGLAAPAVPAINQYAAELKDGDISNGEADVVVAAFHEGTAANTGISDDVDVIINGHSHVVVATTDADGRPVIQPGNFASHFGETELLVDVDDNAVCEVVTNQNITAAVPAGSTRDDFIAAHPRAAAINGIVTTALENAAEQGEVAVAEATADISRGLNDDASLDNRRVESTMSNMVAQMFHDQLGADVPNFIGAQNPGGTRADLLAGTVTYAEAAAVLPFANTLMTTELTGVQLKTMLEQQWQPEGTRPDRAFLALGLSDNVAYTYDESLPRGERITSIFVDGAPVDPATIYTVGSGSFLIAGGDNFFVLADGANTADTGRADLEAWVEWLEDQGSVSPDYSRRGVPFVGETDLATDTEVVWTVGQPAAGSIPNDTLDIRSLNAPANTTLEARLGAPNGTLVGQTTVNEGVAELPVRLPAGTTTGDAVIYLIAPDSGTTIPVPVSVAEGIAPFADVPLGTQFIDEIRWMKEQGLARGWDDGTFRPLQPVARDAMAAFLYRLAGSPSVAGQTEPFSDVTEADEHYDAIVWAYNAGVAEGWPDGTFRPLEGIERNAMMAFIYRYADEPEYQAPTDSPFSDVQPGDPFFAEIMWAYDNGITTGWPDGTFRPFDKTNRDATAAFFYRMVVEHGIDAPR